MKTTRTIKRGILALAMVALTIPAFSQKSFNQFDFKKVTDNILKSTEDIRNAITESFAGDYFYEAQISLEDWMLDLKKFNNRIDSLSEYKSSMTEEIEFIDSEIELESWMMEGDWSISYDLRLDEPEMEVEAWMESPMTWVAPK